MLRIYVKLTHAFAPISLGNSSDFEIYQASIFIA